MGLELAKAWVTIRGDDSKLSGDLGKTKKNVLGSLSSLAGSAGALLAAAGVAVGVGAMVGLGKESIGLAMQQIQNEQRLAAVIRATGGAAGFTAEQLKAQASALQASTTVGDEAIMETQAVLLTFKNISGETFTKTTELALDMAAVLGTDAKSGAIQLGKAMNDPVKGVTALSRAGIQFTDQQKQQIKALVESGQLHKAQTLVLGELKGQLGGVASALAQTGAGQYTQLQNILGDVKEELGIQLLPVAIAFTKAMLDVMPAISGVMIAISKPIIAVIEGFRMLWGMAVKFAAPLNLTPSTWLPGLDSSKAMMGDVSALMKGFVASTAPAYMKSVAQIKAEHNSWADATEKVKKKMEDWRAKMDSMLEGLESRLTPPKSPMEEYLTDLEEINKLHEANLITLQKRNTLLGLAEDKLTKPAMEEARKKAEDAQKQKADERKSAAKSLFDATRTPLENFTSRMAENVSLLKGGDISKETFLRDLFMQKQELEQKRKELTGGFGTGGGFADLGRQIQDKLIKGDMAARQLEELTKHSRFLEGIERGFKEGLVARVTQ